MEDKSMVQPILEAVEYFTQSESEIQYYYKIIDKFCAKWFRKPPDAALLDTVDLLLIHDLLGEFLRFDSNSKRVAMWLLSINRICYNFTVDLTEAEKELASLESGISDSPDNTLIEPVLSTLIKLEELHLSAGDNNRGRQDITGNFLQWVGLYTTFIYPSLENKQDLNDKSILKAMNYLIMEFIKLKSNDKRLAFLIMAVMEGCRQYSNKDKVDGTVIDSQRSFMVTAGTEQALVEELLLKLQEETENQRQRPHLSREQPVDQMLKDQLDVFIDELNTTPARAVTLFNGFTEQMTNNYLMLDDGKKSFLFLETLQRYRVNCRKCLKPDVYNNLTMSINLLAAHTKKWFVNELKKADQYTADYTDYILKKFEQHKATKVNTVKLFIILNLIKKFEINIQ